MSYEYNRPSTPNSIAGFTGTTPPTHHLRSISFDHSYLPPPVPPKNEYTLPRSYLPAQNLYPIFSTSSAWSSDSEDREERQEISNNLRKRHSYRLRRKAKQNPYLDYDFEEADEGMGPEVDSPATSVSSSFFDSLGSLKKSSGSIKRRLGRLSPLKRSSHDDDDELDDIDIDQESGIYDPNPYEWNA